jgi:hypothetical protein
MAKHSTLLTMILGGIICLISLNNREQIILKLLLGEQAINIRWDLGAMKK